MRFINYKWWIFVLMVVLISVLWMGFGHQGSHSSTMQPSFDNNQLVGGLTRFMPGSQFHTGLEQLPASLRGTQVDGQFVVDAQGHLVITNSIRHIFDYFLSTIGEEPLSTVVKRIHAYIHDQLKPPADGQADQLLDAYVAYRKALVNVVPVSVQSSGNVVDFQAVQQQKQQVAQIRAQYLTPAVIQAFFGDEDAYDRYTLGRLSVLQNNGLSAAQKAQQLSALEQQLPANVQASLQVVNQYQDLQAATVDCQQHQCTAAQLRQIREQIVGTQAADRLEALDQQNAQWQQRMDQWYGERSSILNSPNLSASDKQEQIDQLRSTQFDTQEQQRVQALERIHDGGNSVNRNL